MENYLDKIKIFFAITIIFLVTIIISGSFIVKDFNFIDKEDIFWALNYSDYRFSLSYVDNQSLFASIISFFSDISSITENRNNRAKSIPVLLYHGIVDEPDGANVLLKDFKEQMFALKKAGWQTISIEDFYAFMKEEKELPDKSFLLTFDDGRKDSYYPVDPILKALDYNAVIFVITKYSIGDKSGGNYYLSENELKKMIKSGRWEIQPHTREGHDFYKISKDGEQGHFYSNKLWLDNEGRIETEEEFIERIMADMIATKDDLENNLGIKVVGFAYPFGDFGYNSINFPKSELIVSDVAKSIYPISFFQIWPTKGFSFNYPNKNQFLTSRIEVRSYWNANNLLNLLESDKNKDIPFSDDFNDYNGWMKSYGEFFIENNSVVLSSYLTGTLVFLEGSYLWEDYIFLSDMELDNGQIFELFARFQDSNNYISCEFSSEFVKIKYRIGEKKN